MGLGISLRIAHRAAQPRALPNCLGWIGKHPVCSLGLALIAAMVGPAEAAEPALPPITGAAAIVIDRDSGVVLGVKNPDQRRAMASTTKMMTALLAIERNGSNLDAVVGPISAYAAGIQGSRMNLRAGDRVSLRELLYGLLLPSGNDAAVAIAEWISGSEGAFVTLMNQRAQQLGLGNTAYRNPHGRDPTEYGACFSPYTSLPNCGHYSTARDLVTLARFAMSSQALFAQIVKTVSWTPTTWVDASGNHRTDILRNDNLLLSSMPYAGANGVKTGATPNAGYCLVASASRSGRSVMSVVLGCSSDNVRLTESKQLLDYGFSQLLGAQPFANGSFEQDYAGWTATGNQIIGSSPNVSVTDGAKAVAFNDGQRTSNGVLTQSFATTIGQSYVLSFDLGVSSYQSTAEQRMQVTVQGNNSLISQTLSLFGQGTGARYVPKTFTFVADSSTTILTFRDVSPVTFNIDLLLDNVRVTQDGTGTPTPTPTPTATPTPTPLGAFVNGSFESDYTGWTHSGNQRITTTAVSNGAKAIAFNDGNTTPNGVLSQTFATVSGQTYTLSFDAGVTAYQSTAQMRMQVSVQGNSALLSQTVTVSGQGTGRWYTPKSFTLVADGTSATLTVQDTSLATINIDLLLDNVKVQAPTPTPSPSPTPGGLTNGSFENNYTGWTGTGNQDVVSFGATHGVKAVRFNAGQKTPNAVLSQSFATTAGQSHTMSFDYGVYSPVSPREQRLEVTVRGNGVFVSQVISQSAFGSSVQYTPRNYSFAADSSVTTLTFRDLSLTSDSVDSYVDNVQVK